jgi:hypothetical protein
MALDTTIPSELIEMLRTRKVIPFVGAGFSAVLGLPEWDVLLARVSSEIEDALPFADVRVCCGGDPLQIAEYYF